MVTSPPVTRRALALALALATGCGSDPLTEIVVVSDTDLAIPGELDTIRIRVHGDPDRTEEALARVGDGAPRPATLGLVSSSGQGTLEVAVIGELDGAEVVRRTARVAFQPGRVLALRMDLLRSCLASACGEGQTCGERGCRAIEIDPSELTEWSEPGGLDGGARDGGHDDAGPIDAAPIDAAPIDATAPADAGPDSGLGDGGLGDGGLGDGGLGDGGCTGAADCDDSVACTTDACEGGSCTHVPLASACDDAISCTAASCDPIAGCVQTPDDAACDDGIACTVESCDALAGCRSTPVHTTCASGQYCDTAAGCTVAPTFTDVYGTILSARCGPCHTSAGSPGGGLGMATQTQAYLSLVGVTATCGGGTNVRVIARDSARSLLWRKVTGVDLCGDIMPRMGMPLSSAQAALIAHWIEGGALDL